MNQSKGKARPKTSNGNGKSKNRNGRAQRAIPRNGLQTQVFAAPVRVAQSTQNDGPRWSMTKSGGFIVEHSELITLLNGSTTFAVKSVVCQPGLVASFPWLGQVAPSFERHKIHKLQYEALPTKGTDADGTIYMAFDYDAADTAPADELSISQYAHVREVSLGGSTLPVAARTLTAYPIPKDRIGLGVGNVLYTRFAAVSNTDIKTYDAGVLHLAVASSADTTVVARVRAHYRVEFFEPQPNGLAGVNLALGGNFSGTTNAAPYATTAAETNLPATVSSSGTTTSVSTWTFTSPWEGYVSWSLGGTGITSFAPTGTATSVELAELINAGATNAVGVFHMKASAGQTLIVTIGNTTVTASQIYFGQANTAL